MSFVSEFKARLATKQIHVTIDQWPDMLEELNDEYMVLAIKDVVLEAMQVAANDAPVDQGSLAASLRKTDIIVSRVSSREFKVLLKDVVDYTRYVEDGRSPGKFPPPDKLIPWVERNMGLTGKEAKRVAFLIGRKIAREGQVGLEFIQKAIDVTAAKSNP